MTERRNKEKSGYGAVPSATNDNETETEPLNVGKPRVWTVTLFTVIACLGSLLNGFVLGYSSATLSELNSTNASREHHLSSDSPYYSLFGALGPVGALFGGPVAGVVSDYFGRKIGIMIGGVPYTLGWLFITCSNSVPSEDGFIALFEMGRFFTGFGMGWMSLCVPVYITEISTAKLKGLFGACQQLFVTLGIFFVEILGAVSTYSEAFRYYHVSLVSLALVLIFEALMLITKETPRWLLSKRKPEEAKKVLEFIRGPEYDTNRELNEMMDGMKKQPNLSLVDTVREFRHRSVLFPFLLAMGFALFQQLSGINAAIFYAATIFEEAQVANPTLVSSFAIGAVQVVFTLANVLLVDLAGRKILLVIGSVTLALSGSMIGTEFILSHRLCNSGSCQYSPLAIVGVIVYIMAFSIAWGAIPWLMMSELIPQRVKGLSSGIVTAFNWTLAAIVTGTFKYFSDAVQSWGGAWWIFAAIMVGSIFFVVFLVPETKGRSLEEIERFFERRHGAAGERQALVESNAASVN